METIEIEEFLSVDEARKEYPSLFHTYKTLLGLSNQMAAEAVSIHVGVCRHCREAPRGCQCWNDA